jgi:peptidoglycan/xylan/chitin deacetylase (PgdA/CDA1 family)
VAAAAGYTTTVMWALDTIDWRAVADGGPTALDIATKIRDVPAGGIVLDHLGGWNTLDGLPYAIAGLRARALTPTSISGLLD